MATQPITLQIDMAGLLHPGQLEVAKDPARFKVLDAGRRWGKTKLGGLLCTLPALEGKVIWWVAPTYLDTRVGWRVLKQLGKQIPGSVIREGERRIEYPGGGWVEVRSADREDSLRSEGLDGLVFDEAALARETAWTEELRPALADKKGWAVFISTPKGKNWFWRLYGRGQAQDGDWKSWQFPSTNNPFLDPAEIEDARSETPDMVYRQEYLAEFIDDAGGVFRRVMDGATGVFGEPCGRDTVMGVDWGKHNDFTVLTVMDVETRAAVAWDRFNKIDYAFQCDRLKLLHSKWKCRTILAEQNSMGEPLIEGLVRDGLPVEGFTTTAQSKPELIESLSLGIEQGLVTYPPIQELIFELQAFEYERLPSGKLRYTAPGGSHDDCVISLALANKAAIDILSVVAASGGIVQPKIGKTWNRTASDWARHR